VVVDSVGRVWFTDRLTHAIGSFDPSTGRFERYPTPTQPSTPYGLLVSPDGGLWYGAAGASRLGRVDPATAVITEHPIPDASGGPQLLAWRDGEIWFGLRESRGYGRFSPSTGASTVYRLETHRPYSVAATAEAVWFSSYGSFRLLEVDPITGAATVHELRTAEPTDSAQRAAGLSEAAVRLSRTGRLSDALRVAAVSADALWFTDFGGGRVIRYDTRQRTLRSYPSLDPRSEPYGITISHGGLIWYGEKNTNRIVVLDPVHDQRVAVTMPTAGGVVRNIVVDEKRGRAWLPLSDRGLLGLIEFR
jgi:streptogramin lyase